MTTELHDPIERAELERRLRDTFRTVMPLLDGYPRVGQSSTEMDAAALVEFEAFAHDPRRPRSGARLIAVAAVLLVLTGAVALTVRTVHKAGRVIPAASDTRPVAMILKALPGGLERTRSGGVIGTRREPSGYVVHLYGSTVDPGDPSRMVRVEYARSESMGGCDAAAEPFLVGDHMGATCEIGGATTVSWTVDAVGITANASIGSRVTIDEAKLLLDSLVTVTRRAVASYGPSADLVAQVLPAGWIPLLYDDVPYTQQITEANWVASVGGADDAGFILVSTWTGLDDGQAIFARQQPILAQRISVRGHDAYEYVSPQRGEGGPLQIDVWWEEQPGMVVYVSVTDLFEPDVLNALLDQLVPVDAAGFRGFR